MHLGRNHFRNIPECVGDGGFAEVDAFDPGSKFTAGLVEPGFDLPFNLSHSVGYILKVQIGSFLDEVFGLLWKRLWVGGCHSFSHLNEC